MTPPTVTRRAFVATAIGAGTLAVPLSRGAAAATQDTVYKLTADWGAGNTNCVPNRGQADCGGCYACVLHARNKVFATAAAADAGRAHPRCKCLVEPFSVVGTTTYRELFANGLSVDRRTPGVNELLDRSSSARPADQAPLAMTGASLVPLLLTGGGTIAVGTVLWRAGRMNARGAVERPAAPHPEPVTVPTTRG